MRKLNSLKIGFTEAMIMFVILILLGVVIAQPGLPHQFYGDVKCLNNNTVPNGLNVYVKTNNILIKSTTTFNGQYGYEPVFLIWGLEDNTLLDFYVNNKHVSSYKFLAGQTTRLDLFVDTDICSPTNNPSNPGSGSGSASGSGSSFGIGPIAIAINDLGALITNRGDINNNPGNKTQNHQPANFSEIIFNYDNPLNINKVVALNISLCGLIIMALISLYSIRRLKKPNQLCTKSSPTRTL